MVHPSDMNSSSQAGTAAGRSASTLRRAIWRGSGIIAPPLVTLVLLIWAASAVETYVLKPVEGMVRAGFAWATSEIRANIPPGSTPLDPANPRAGFVHEGETYVLAPAGGRYLPQRIITRVDSRLDDLPRDLPPPRTARAYYEAYITLRYLPRWLTIPVVLIALLSALYVIGRFFGVGIGRILVNSVERVINRLPIVRNVYSSVKQVTDFVLSERELEFTRVVLLEYPRVGIWTMAFVTGDGIPQLGKILGDEIVSIFVPTSPVPMTGFTMNVRKRDLIDVDVSVDQAVQFMVSCGVVCPAPPVTPYRPQTVLLPPAREQGV
jgi:uncharacterized membrane protein